MNELLKTILLGIIEGITEFLPVSSTGHLFLVEQWLGIPVDKSPDGQFWKAFGIVIQIGAIFAVVIYFRRRIMGLLAGSRSGSHSALRGGRAVRGMTPLEISQMASAGPGSAHSTAPALDYDSASDGRSATGRWHVIQMILIGALPILIVGKFLDPIASYLEERPVAIALALLIGGIIMLVIERLPIAVTTQRMEEMNWKQALTVGLTQILAALFPGTSRSAATIMPGMVVGLSRPVATEFSFFLAIPVMFAACGYKLLKFLLDKGNHPNSDQLLLLAIGTVVSFMVAWVVIAGFMTYVRRHSFVSFALYRIVFGAVVLAWAWRHGIGPG